MATTSAEHTATTADLERLATEATIDGTGDETGRPFPDFATIEDAIRALRSRQCAPGRRVFLRDEADFATFEEFILSDSGMAAAREAGTVVVATDDPAIRQRVLALYRVAEQRIGASIGVRDVIGAASNFRIARSDDRRWRFGLEEARNETGEQRRARLHDHITFIERDSRTRNVNLQLGSEGLDPEHTIRLLRLRATRRDNVQFDTRTMQAIFNMLRRGRDAGNAACVVVPSLSAAQNVLVNLGLARANPKNPVRPLSEADCLAVIDTFRVHRPDDRRVQAEAQPRGEAVRHDAEPSPAPASPTLSGTSMDNVDVATLVEVSNEPASLDALQTALDAGKVRSITIAPGTMLEPAQFGRLLGLCLAHQGRVIMDSRTQRAVYAARNQVRFEGFEFTDVEKEGCGTEQDVRRSKSRKLGRMLRAAGIVPPNIEDKFDAPVDKDTIAAMLAGVAVKPDSGERTLRLTGAEAEEGIAMAAHPLQESLDAETDRIHTEMANSPWGQVVTRPLTAEEQADPEFLRRSVLPRLLALQREYGAALALDPSVREAILAAPYDRSHFLLEGRVPEYQPRPSEGYNRTKYDFYLGKIVELDIEVGDLMQEDPKHEEDMLLLCEDAINGAAALNTSKEMPDARHTGRLRISFRTQQSANEFLLSKGIPEKLHRQWKRWRACGLITQSMLEETFPPEPVPVPANSAPDSVVQEAAPAVDARSGLESASAPDFLLPETGQAHVTTEARRPIIIGGEVVGYEGEAPESAAAPNRGPDPGWRKRKWRLPWQQKRW